MQNTQRYVIFAYLLAGIIVWATIARLLSTVAYATNLPDPALIGSQFTLTTFLGFAAAVALGLYAYRHAEAQAFVTDVFGELSKVTWPSKLETRTATIVVIVTTLIMAAVLGLFDLVWAKLTGLIYS